MGVIISSELRSLSELDRWTILVTCIRGIPFRSNNSLYDEMVNQFSVLLGKKKFNAVEWFFTNAAKVVRNDAIGFTTKLTASYWTGNVAGVSYRGVVDVLSWMQENGYVVLYKGYKDITKGKSYPTVVVLTEKLTALFNSKQVHLHLPKQVLDRLIVIKDRKNRELMPTIEIDVQDLEQEMRSYNKSLQTAHVEFMGKPIPLIEYKRSFSDNLMQGGRLYVNGGGVQLIPSDYRLEHLTIEGEKVIELDYSSNHPSILYELLVQDKPHLLEYCKDIVPYNADNSFIEFLDSSDKVLQCHLTSIGSDYSDFRAKGIRRYYKLALMLCINTKSLTDAVRCLGHEFYKDSLKPIHEREFYGLVKPYNQRIIQAIAEHNSLISDSFYVDAGVRLQLVDSRIALRVIDLLTQQGITVLCYHDSFVAQEKWEDTLYVAMVEAWKNVLGNNVFCKIDKRG